MTRRALHRRSPPSCSSSPPPRPRRADWVWPVRGEVITPYRNGDDPYAAGQHRGIDIAAALGTPRGRRGGRRGPLRRHGGLVGPDREHPHRGRPLRHLLPPPLLDGGRARASASRPASASGRSARPASRSAEQPHLHFGVRDAGSKPRLPRPARASCRRPRSRRSGRARRPRRARAGRSARAATRARAGPAPRRVPAAQPVPGASPRPGALPHRARPPGAAPHGARPRALRARPGSRRSRPHALPRARPLAPLPAPLPDARASRSAGARRVAHGSPSAPGASGPDLGYALACLGLLAAAALLGLSEDGRQVTRRSRDRVAGACDRSSGGVDAVTGRGRCAPLSSIGIDVVLRHDAHLLRERRAAPGARLHDDRRRRPRAAHAPARRGRLLPHGHRRARRAGDPGGRAARHHPARAGRPQRGPLQGARRHAQRHQRLLHPHDRPRAHGQGRRGRPAHPRQRPRLRRHLRGLVLPALRRLQDRLRARGRQPLPDPQDRARDREGGQLVLPAVDLPGAARAPLRRAPRFRGPAQPLQRGALVHQERPARRLAQPRPAQVGRAGPVGRVAGDLRLDRRAAQLLHGAVLRARGRGPDRALLAGGRPPDRQGHPQVPRRDLARDADGRRHRGPGAGGHPRVPAAGRAQDVQVARQRDRAVPGRRDVRRRRAALLRPARGQLRRGRRGVARGLRDPLQHRARQRVRQPRQPHAGDDRRATATASSRTPSRRRRCGASSKG